MAPNITGDGGAHMDDERAGLGVRTTVQLRQWVDRAQGLGVPLGCGGPTTGQISYSFRRGGATILLGADVFQLLTNDLRTLDRGRQQGLLLHRERALGGPAAISFARPIWLV